MRSGKTCYDTDSFLGISIIAFVHSRLKSTVHGWPVASDTLTDTHFRGKRRVMGCQRAENLEKQVCLYLIT